MPPQQTRPPVHVTGVWVQTPFWHVSIVHGLPSEVHPVPFGLGWTWQMPVLGLQTLTVQGFPVGGHVVSVPGWQVPFWQVSPTVHRLPSSQGVPFATALHVPVAGSQTWHCGQVTV